MAKKLTKTSFIKNYLGRKVRSGQIKGYGDWIIENLPSYQKSSKKVNTGADYARLLASHATKSESLSADGLSGGGYAGYLASSLKAKKPPVARETETLTDSHDRTGYEKYIGDYINSAAEIFDGARAKEAQARESAYRRILSEKIIDYREALDRARELGAARGDAEEIARRASREARDTLKASILDLAVRRAMTGNAAQAYALSRGLDETEARAIAETVKTINQLPESGLPQSYLDYLRELEEQYKNQNK